MKLFRPTRVAHRIIGAMLLAVSLALGVVAGISVRSERALFEQDTVDDHAIFGRLVQAVLSGVRQVCGVAGLSRLVSEVNIDPSRVKFRWRMLDRGTAAPGVAVAELERLRRDEDVVRVGVGAHGVPTVTTLLPVDIDETRIGILSIEEALDKREAVADRALWMLVLQMGLVAVVIALVGWITVERVVSRPLDQLVSLSQRIGAGELDARIDLSRNDELSALAAALYRMCDGLNASRGQLQHVERLTTAGRLAAGVAHEVGTPLNVISGTARSIETGECDGEEARAAARTIREQAARITHLVQDLLAFARRKATERSPVDLRDAVDLAVRLLEPTARARRVGLAWERAPEGLIVLGSSAQLQQVVANLLTNALDASREGGRVSVRAARDGAEAKLEVTDEGQGIAAENLSRIFEPFFTTKDVGQGTGLGLSIVHGILADHGGRIDVTSQVNVGTTFVVRLPLAEVA